MFSLRNLTVAGVACIPVLGLLFGAFIGIAWLRAFMTLGNWRAFPLALIVATIYFGLNVAVLAPVPENPLLVDEQLRNRLIEAAEQAFFLEDKNFDAARQVGLTFDIPGRPTGD